MLEEVKRSFKWLVYWSWQRRGIRHRWTLKGITMVSTYVCTYECSEELHRMLRFTSHYRLSVRNHTMLRSVTLSCIILLFRLHCVALVYFARVSKSTMSYNVTSRCPTFHCIALHCMVLSCTSVPLTGLLLCNSRT